MINSNNIEELGKLADDIDNCISMLNNPFVPAALHIQALKEILPTYSEKIKTIVKEESGGNPWE